jgi:hypothetical protein
MRQVLLLHLVWQIRGLPRGELGSGVNPDLYLREKLNRDLRPRWAAKYLRIPETFEGESFCTRIEARHLPRAENPYENTNTVNLPGTDDPDFFRRAGGHSFPARELEDHPASGESQRQPNRASFTWWHCHNSPIRHLVRTR